MSSVDTILGNVLVFIELDRAPTVNIAVGYLSSHNEVWKKCLQLLPEADQETFHEYEKIIEKLVDDRIKMIYKGDDAQRLKDRDLWNHCFEARKIV